MAFGKAFKAMGSKRPGESMGRHMMGKEKETPAGKVDGGSEDSHDSDSTVEGAEESKMKANGDGSYSSDGPTGPMDHPTLGHALMHIANHHEPMKDPEELKAEMFAQEHQPEEHHAAVMGSGLHG